jgi:hypothetical protein
MELSIKTGGLDLSDAPQGLYASRRARRVLHGESRRSDHPVGSLTDARSASSAPLIRLQQPIATRKEHDD